MQPIQSRVGPSVPQVMPTFKAIVPDEVVRALVEVSKKRFYERLYPPLIVVWGFIFQRLNADHTLDAVVSHLASGAADHITDRHLLALSARIGSPSTAAYAKARQRLPEEVLPGVVRHLAQAAVAGMGEVARWHGHRVALLDGTTLLTMPEPDLVTHYGQAENQHGVAHWVVIRAVAAFCLHSAALLTIAEGSQRVSEQILARTVFNDLPPDTICLGDANFGVFQVAQAARHCRVWCLLRLTAGRTRAMLHRSLGPREDLPFGWAPSSRDQRDPTLSAAPIAGRLIGVHLERDGFRPIDLSFFTTLTDSTVYPLNDLVVLYSRRWQVELNLRDVKSTLDMDLLTAKSVAMVRKELWAGLACYNLVRLCMVMAAHAAGIAPGSLSFTACWRRVQQAISALRPRDTRKKIVQQRRDLLTRLAQCRLQTRAPFRVEPREVRRRPMVYPALKGPRNAARQRTLQQLTTGNAKC